MSIEYPPPEATPPDAPRGGRVSRLARTIAAWAGDDPAPILLLLLFAVVFWPLLDGLWLAILPLLAALGGVAAWIGRAGPGQDDRRDESP